MFPRLDRSRHTIFPSHTSDNIDDSKITYPKLSEATNTDLGRKLCAPTNFLVHDGDQSRLCIYTFNSHCSTFCRLRFSALSVFMFKHVYKNEYPEAHKQIDDYHGSIPCYLSSICTNMPCPGTTSQSFLTITKIPDHVKAYWIVERLSLLSQFEFSRSSDA